VTGNKGRITRPITKLPLRLSGTWHFRLDGAGQPLSDVAVAGIVFADGSRIALAASHLGQIVSASINEYGAQDDTFITARGPNTHRAGPTLDFRLIVAEDRLFASSGEKDYFEAVTLTKRPTHLIFAVISDQPAAPVDLNHVELSELKP
jgi:hypothetical protein